MTDITLSNIGSGYNLNKINDNFETIEDVVNAELLHTEGGNNTMRQALDMNSNPVINGYTDLSNPTNLLTVEAADRRYNTKLGNENTSGLGEFRFNSVAQMKSMTDITGNTFTEDEIAALADSGAILHTNAYYIGTSVGGDDYQIRTRASYRTEIGDAVWVPNGIVEHYLLGGSTYVAVPIIRTQSNSRQWGLPGSMTPQDRAITIQTMWNWCAENGVKAVMCPDRFTVQIPVIATGISHTIMFPSNLTVHFEMGFYIEHIDFVEDDSHWNRLLVLGRNTHNVTATGCLEINGKGDTVSWYVEHNHCIFFYGCKDIDMSGLHIIAYNSMGDCVSISGGNNTTILTERVRIGSIDCTKLNSAGVTARRKSLVIEANADVWLGHVVLNNGDGYCLDYEPFGLSMDGKATSTKIDYLKCFSGADFTSGETERVGNLIIDTWIIEIPEGSNFNGYCIFSYSAAVRVNYLRIDYRHSTQPDVSALYLSHNARWDVNKLDIYTSDFSAGRGIEGVSYGTVYLLSSTQFGKPHLICGNLTIKGRGNKIINNQSGYATIGSVFIEGGIEGGALSDLGAAHIMGQMNTTNAFLTIESCVIKNAKSPRFINFFSFSGGNFPVKIGSLTVINNDPGYTNYGVYGGSSGGLPAAVEINSYNVIGTPPGSFYGLNPGYSVFYKIRGGFNSPCDFLSNAANPNNIIARRGSTCTTSDGSVWVKTVDDDGEGDGAFGWTKLAVVTS